MVQYSHVLIIKSTKNETKLYPIGNIASVKLPEN